MYLTAVNEMEVMDLNEVKEEYLGGFGENRKRK